MSTARCDGSLCDRWRETISNQKELSGLRWKMEKRRAPLHHYTIAFSCWKIHTKMYTRAWSSRNQTTFFPSSLLITCPSNPVQMFYSKKDYFSCEICPERGKYIQCIVRPFESSFVLCTLGPYIKPGKCPMRIVENVFDQVATLMLMWNGVKGSETLYFALRLWFSSLFLSVLK